MAGALVLGACDAGEGPPGDPAATQTLESALAGLADYEGVALTFSLESTPEDLALLDEGSRVLDRDTAETILDSSLTIVSTDTGAAIVFDVGGAEDAVELRVVDGTLFVRADVRELFETFEADPGRLDAVIDRGGQLGLDFVGQAIDGQWLGIADAARVAEQLTGSEAPVPAKTDATGARLATILGDDPAVTSEGTDAAGERLSVRLPLRESLDRFLVAVKDLGGLPADVVPLPDTSRLPEDDVTLDAWIDDGRLAQLETDLLELGDVVGEEPPEGVDRYALRMRIEEVTSDVEAPAGARMVDPRRILGALLEGLAGLAD